MISQNWLRWWAGVDDPLPAPILAKLYGAICHHQGPMSQSCNVGRTCSITTTISSHVVRSTKQYSKSQIKQILKKKNACLYTVIIGPADGPALWVLGHLQAHWRLSSDPVFMYGTGTWSALKPFTTHWFPFGATGYLRVDRNKSRDRHVRSVGDVNKHGRLVQTSQVHANCGSIYPWRCCG